ncbi:MAG: YbaK/EbsC family protein [Pseudomonadota bacterium]
MSKSLKRVCADAEARGLEIDPIRLDDGTTTAAMAADAVGAAVGQIVKSVVLRAVDGDEHVLFLTSGDNQVDLGRASEVAGCALEKADAASIRAFTGFAIGGVSPLGHKTPIRTYFDPHLHSFPVVWAAAGTPHHVFRITPDTLARVTGAQEAVFT